MEPIGKLLEKILLHYERKEYVSAERLADELLASYPNFHQGMFLKAVILEETGRPEEAQKYYGKTGNLSFLWFRLALQLHDADPERALRCYGRVGDMGRYNNLLWFNKGLLYEKSGRPEEARECFRKLSPAREVFSGIMVPLGFIIFLVIGAVMMITRGDKTLASLLVISAVFCVFWLRRDAGKAVQMLVKKRKYK